MTQKTYEKFYSFLEREYRTREPNYIKGPRIGIDRVSLSKIRKEGKPLSYKQALAFLNYAGGKLDWNDLPGWDWHNEKVKGKFLKNRSLVKILSDLLRGHTPKMEKDLALYCLQQADGDLEWEDIPGYNWRIN